VVVLETASVLLAGVVLLSTTAALVANVPSIAAITPAMETGVYQLMEHVAVSADLVASTPVLETAVVGMVDVGVWLRIAGLGVIGCLVLVRSLFGCPVYF
jgi:hypothetical protein